MELNIEMEPSHFPKFLSQSHIEYLIKLSNLQIERTQLKIIFKSLKQRRVKIREKESMELLAKTTQFSSHPITKKSSVYFSLPPTVRKSINFNEENFNTKTMNNFDKNLQKYEKFMKSINEKWMRKVKLIKSLQL